MDNGAIYSIYNLSLIQDSCWSAMLVTAENSHNPIDVIIELCTNGDYIAHHQNESGEDVIYHLLDPENKMPINAVAESMSVYIPVAIKTDYKRSSLI